MTWTDMENFFTRFLEIAGQIEGEKFYSYSIAVSRVLSRQYARCFLVLAIFVLRYFYFMLSTFSQIASTCLYV